MYRLMICDDEKTIRQGLCKVVDWGALGFEVCGAFEDGSDALEYARENPVDALLTDIKMYDVSGLELIRKIKEVCPDVVSVILSGYKQFEYAKEAIELGVHAFLVKPIDFTELQQVFGEISMELSTKAQQQQQSLLQEKEQEEQKNLLQEQFFYELLEGLFTNGEEMDTRARLCGLPGGISQQAVSLVAFSFQGLETFLSERWQYGRDRFKALVRNTFELGQEKCGIALLFSGKMEQNRAIFYGDFAASATSVAEVAKEKAKALQELTGLTCLVGEALLFKTGEAVLAWQQQSRAKTEGKNMFGRCDADIKAALMNHIHENDQEMMRRVIDKLFEPLSDFSAAQQTATALAQNVLEEFKKMDANLFDNPMIQKEFFGMATAGAMDNIRQSLFGLCRQVAKQIYASSVSQQNQMMETVEHYLQQNYHRDITLEEVASTVFLSPAYFSTIFRERAGINYSEYLFRIRMEHARELLKNPKYRVGDVCTLSGYNNVKYFTTCFKKHTGCTPSEYRQRYLMQN